MSHFNTSTALDELKPDFEFEKFGIDNIQPIETLNHISELIQQGNEATESKGLKELETEFEGRGEVKGFHFKQLHKSDAGYLYKVNTSDLHYHYEVFQRKVNRQYKLCVLSSKCLI
jgi:hypothetical protein